MSLDKPSAGEDTAQEHPPYAYPPLDHTVDGIRLVVIEPSRGEHNSSIKCRIRHVAFKEKPRYEALSYTWGDEPAQGKVLIDGGAISVGPNLMKALLHLREPEDERVLWVDAICINQEDVHERNKQISIMPYIYTRARNVLVWLGVPSRVLGKYDDDIALLWQMTFFPKHRGESHIHGIKLLDGMCRELYWTRLWIIQEISLARKILICYGHCKVDWEQFHLALARVKFSNAGYQVVRKLYQQIEEKYKDGHKLQHLLESHQNALCKEPRDHVYGFVGLASDCFDGFPIDYQKSLYEVWKDTAMHRRGDREEYRHNMIKFGCLTRRLLGGPDIALPGEVARDLNLRMALVPPKRDSLHFTTRLVGNISALGPTHNEVIAVLKKTAEWKSIIHRHTNEENVPAALEESDMFLEVLEHVGDAALEAIARFDLETLWKGTEMAEVEPDVKVFDGKAYWGTEENRAQGEIPNLVNIPEGRQLFLLNIRRREPGYPGGMGLGPPNTQRGLHSPDGWGPTGSGGPTPSRQGKGGGNGHSCGRHTRWTPFKGGGR